MILVYSPLLLTTCLPWRHRHQCVSECTVWTEYAYLELVLIHTYIDTYCTTTLATSHHQRHLNHNCLITHQVQNKQTNP